jgi:hypothetical protein
MVSRARSAFLARSLGALSKVCLKLITPFRSRLRRLVVAYFQMASGPIRPVPRQANKNDDFLRDGPPAARYAPA